MDRIIATIVRNNRGSAVQNLQDGLVLILDEPGSQILEGDRTEFIEKLQAEQRVGVYGDVTTEAVARFERAKHTALGRGPGDGTRVDETIALALNRMLEELGAFALAQPESFMIIGHVEFEDGTPARDVRVDVFDRDIGHHRVRLGSVDAPSFTNGEGKFSPIRYGAREVVEGEGSRGPNADLVFEVTAAEDQSARSIVALFRRFAAGGAVTEERVPDLVAGFEVGQLEDVRIVLRGRPSERGWGEYARLMLALKPLLLERVTPADFDQEQCRDIDFSARESGWDRALIETLVLAWKLARAGSREPQRLAETFYGLLRQGPPTQVAPLVAATLGEVLDQDARFGPKLEESLALRIIDGDLQLHLGLLRELHVDAAAKPGDGRRGTISDVLEHANVSSEDQRSLLSAYYAHSGSFEEFWGDVVSKRLGWPAEKVHRAQAALELADSVSYDLPLLSRLRERGIAEARSLVKLERAEWVNLVKQVGTLPDAPGATPDEQILRTVEAIMAGVAAAYPTETLAHLAATSRDPQLAAARDLLAGFFERETALDEPFDIRSSPVTTYLETHAERVFAGLEPGNRTLLTTQLQRLQRVFRLGVDRAQTEALLDLGLDSAFQITRSSPEHFVARFGDQLGGAERAALAYGRAEKIAGTTLYVHTELWQGVHAVQPMAIRAGWQPERIPALKELPVYRALFGSEKSCACGHCQSFYSPAAYFVDLLHMLDQRGPGPNPVEVLFRRRPDLGHIQLTCENTNTLIPYVDLVTEVLEAFVATDGPVAFNVPPGPPNRLLATPGAEELRVNPVYLTAASAKLAGDAYAALQEAVFPLSLPLNLPLETTRTYLEHLGVTRASLMRLLQRDDSFDTLMARAAETLLISPEEFELITGAKLGGASSQRPATVAEFFGLSTTSDPKIAFNHATPEFERNPAKPDERKTLIRSLHNVLDLLSTAPIPVPGEHEYDAATEAAVNAFLTSKGLVPNGRTDEAFWGALEADGMPPLSVMLCPVAMFLERSGLDYAELVALVRTRFVNRTLQGEGDFDYLSRLGIPAFDVRVWIQAGFPAMPARIENAVLAASEDPLVFTEWVKRRSRSIVINTAFDAPCDLDRQTLMHLDGTLLSPDELVELFRFIRLWRKLGWSIEDVDHVLDPSALRGGDVFSTIVLLANVKLLRARTSGPLSDLVTLWQSIPTHGSPTRYDELLRNRAAQLSDPIFELNRDRTELRAALGATAPELSDHLVPLLAAFRVTAHELELVRAAVGLPDDLSVVPPARPLLTLGTLSAIYRPIALARLLRLSVRELLILLDLAGISVFERPDRVLDTQASLFIDRVENVRASGIKVAVLEYLCRGAPEPAGSADTLPSVWSRTLAVLLDGLHAIASEDPIGDDPNGEELTARLTSLFGADDARASMELVYGKDIYTAKLVGLPSAFVFPPSLAGRISYDVARKELTLRGAMSKDDRDLLLSAGPAAPATLSKDYVRAVNTLAAEPRTFAERVLSVLFTLSEAEKLLINASSLDGSGEPIPSAIDIKRAELLARRRNALSRGLIKQTLATATGLNPDSVEVLLENSAVLTALSGAEPAIEDYRTLEGNGVDAEYFSNPDLTTPAVLVRTDETIGFELQGAVPAQGVPAVNFSVRWTGSLYVPATGEVDFSVRCTDGARLTVNRVPVIDEWRDQTESEFNATLRLDGGQFYPIQVDYYNKTGNALLELGWGSPAIPAAPIPRAALYTAGRVESLVVRVQRIYKLALLLAPFELSARDLRLLGEQGKLQLDRMPVGGPAPLAAAKAMFEEWLVLYDFASLRDQYSTGDVSLLDVTGAPTSGWAIELFSVLAATPSERVAAVVETLTVSTFDSVKSTWATVEPDPTELATWRRVSEVLAVMDQTGARPEQLLAWARVREIKDSPTGPETVWHTWTLVDENKTDRQAENNRLAQAAKDLVRARYDGVRWRTEAQLLNDALRIRRRSTLTAYVLALPEMLRARVTDANRLFEFLLIDVEMGPCANTSRIVQAYCSVQTFVQRILLGAEAPELPPGCVDGERRKWMETYRVWEANRKVFIYPESYIEGDLRDDKTPLFKELESELLQDELNDANAERCIRHYLEKVDYIAKLIVCGTCVDSENGILHVFARTSTTPFEFYHRTLDNSRGLDWPEGTWTPWQNLPIDVATIEDGDDSGAHLLPVVWNRRLYLFWPLFEQKPDTRTNERLPGGFDPINCWHIRLAWSEYKDGQWSPKRTGAPVLVSRANILPDSQSLSEPKYFEVKKIHHAGYWIVSSPSSLLPDPISSAVVDAAADAFGLRRRTWVPPWDEPSPSAILASEDSMLTGVVLKNGDWAVHTRTLTTTKLTSLLPKPRDHYLDVVTSGSSLSIRVLCRFSGIRKGQARTVIEDDVVVVRDGQRTDRKERSESFERADGGGIQSFQVLGTFSLLSCTADLQLNRAITTLNYDALKRPERTSNAFMAWAHQKIGIERATSPLRLISGAAPILQAVPTTFNVIDSDNRSGFDRDSPFFFQDDRRCYLVTRAKYAHYKGGIAAEFALGAHVGIEARATGLQTIADRHLGLAPDAQLRANSWARSALVKWAGGPGLPAALRSDVPPAMDQVAGSFVAADRLNPDAIFVRPAEKVYPEYTFTPHWHPYTCPLTGALNSGGLSGLFTLENQQLTDAKLIIVGVIGGPLSTFVANNFESNYKPDRAQVVQPYPVESVDFNSTGSYSKYNWELFFHIPIRIANALRREGRHEEAARWFHYVFDPMTPDTDTSEKRAWRFLPFRDADTRSIEVTLKLLTYTGTDPVELRNRANLQASIQEWLEQPFNPHLIARRRYVAYMKSVFMQYLDNLIEWADKLFDRDTLEAVNEATQLYVLAGNLLGPRPERVPAPGPVAPETYQTLRTRLDALSNAQVDLETRLPFTQLFGAGTGTIGQLTRLPQTLYFCLPQNDRLLAYWDTIADRLFKIRHCMSLDGTVRQLPLFDPPIDPMLLVESVAHGVDIGSVLNDLYAPLPRYRFSYMLQQALAMCNEVRSLGSLLLSVLEKRDAERLAALRAGNETQLLNQVKANKKLQVDEVEQSRQALDETARMTNARLQYYENLIQQGLIAEEIDQLGSLDKSNRQQAMASAIEASAQALNLIPNVSTGSESMTSFGGSNLGAAASAVGKSVANEAAAHSYRASRASITGGHTRRAEEWHFQRDHAKRELAQIARQQTAARIRKEIAEADLRNHETSIEHARGIEEFLRTKFTNEALYGWMEEQLRGTFFQCYKAAYELARGAQRCFQYQLGTDATFVKYGAWDSSVRGLLAGETLYLQLKQMERAHTEQQTREFEITKSISILQLDPLALIELKETGACEMDVPEWLFDLDFAGHYFRRLKSVSVSIPAVVGPYTSLSATLTLLSSKVREVSRVKGTYGDDENYRHDNVRVDAIAVSTGQNDSGKFQLDFRDEKYLPFEGAGVISRWRLELPGKALELPGKPKQLRSFDYDTISDLILQFKYISRRDQTLAPQAAKELLAVLDAAGKGTLFRLFSLRHEFPNEWHNLKAGTTHTALLTLPKDRFPLLAQTGTITVSEVQFVLILKEPKPTVTYKAKVTQPGAGVSVDVDWPGQPSVYRKAAKSNAVTVSVSAKAEDNAWKVQLTAPTVAANVDTIKDLLIAVRYSVVV